MKIKQGIFSERSGEVVTTVDRGAIVRRGPDWRFENQGGGGCGKILGESIIGWVMVKWDNGLLNSYSITERDGYHLAYV